ncbi:hypothetical protein COEREDRAFT_87712 [Coemansia reversa NRRL 1564]|uniref:Uncharacterized protein n=1 Tax=Coemansia reversa (strain ATCC 12441 / NRRL 1564) TaxID=763665 RepID=A0A2G5B956_COERN|nr:hypothetical protein COEREDRAFT_87712 [Coemansia reversa NRRL 1564]|eukprot:PIA15520.1 hypothetical protein COEREDRAFT_87712 [Coemansia reversa NRRL 1564]
MGEKSGFQNLPQNIIQRIIYFSTKKTQEPIQKQDSAQEENSDNGKQIQESPEHNQPIKANKLENKPEEKSSENFLPFFEVCRDWRAAAKNYFDTSNKTKVSPEPNNEEDSSQVMPTKPKILIRKHKSDSKSSESASHQSKLARFFKR